MYTWKIWNNWVYLHDRLPSLVEENEDQLIAQGGLSDDWLEEMEADISSVIERSTIKSTRTWGWAQEQNIKTQSRGIWGMSRVIDFVVLDQLYYHCYKLQR